MNLSRSTWRGVVSLLSGVVFGVGLAVAGMTHPNKVLGFLDVTVVVIVFTETEDETHIISMRKATKNEQIQFFM